MSDTDVSGMQGLPTGWAAAEANYAAAGAAMQSDLLWLKQLLADIVGRVDSKGKAISTGQAYQELVELSGGMIQVKGDTAGQQGAAQTLGALGTTTTNQINADFTATAGATGSLSDATDFVNGLTKLEAIAEAQAALPAGSSSKWMDNATSAAIIKSVDAIWKMFGGTASSPPSGQTVLTQIQAWVNAPAGSSGRSQALENLQQLSGQISSIGSGFSALTSLQSGLEQNTMAQVSQMVNTMRGTISSIVTSVMRMIQNETAS